MKFKCNGAVSFENHRSQTSVLLFNLLHCLKHTPVGCRGVNYVVGIVVQLKWMFSLVFSPEILYHQMNTLKLDVRKVDTYLFRKMNKEEFKLKY